MKEEKEMKKQRQKKEEESEGLSSTGSKKGPMDY